MAREHVSRGDDDWRCPIYERFLIFCCGNAHDKEYTWHCEVLPLLVRQLSGMKTHHNKTKAANASVGNLVASVHPHYSSTELVKSLTGCKLNCFAWKTVTVMITD